MNTELSALVVRVSPLLTEDHTELSNAIYAFDNGDWSQALESIALHDAWVRAQTPLADTERIARTQSTLLGLIQLLIVARNECADAIHALRGSKGALRNYRNALPEVIGNEQ